MRIYNEVITQFNDITGQWDTIYEDSEEYNGPMAFMQGGLPPNASSINTSDTIADTIKTTAGYFTNGDGTMAGADMYTASLNDTNELYYFNVQQAPDASASSAVQFSVTYGHVLGSGSDCYGDSSTNPNNLRGETEAVYRQLATLLMDETEASGGFKIGQSGTDMHAKGLASGERDEYIYVITGRRERFKDRVNKKAWTLILSGSDTDETSVDRITLTDDSKDVPAVATPGGPRYNIVSGALGTVEIAATTKTYGWFYPEMGMMVFSGAQLSASIPGASSSNAAKANVTTNVAPYVPGSDFSEVVNEANDIRVTGSGFAPNLDNNGPNAKNALKLINCLQLGGKDSTILRLRSEEDQTQENYFCRIRATEYNFSANPTFVSGSKNKIRNLDMHGNPQTFITGCGLYNSAGQLLAIAKLSSPLKKNFASEATIKVKLTY